MKLRVSQPRLRARVDGGKEDHPVAHRVEEQRQADLDERGDGEESEGGGE
jgi:hypothetical protein